MKINDISTQAMFTCLTDKVWPGTKGDGWNGSINFLFETSWSSACCSYVRQALLNLKLITAKPNKGKGRSFTYVWNDMVPIIDTARAVCAEAQKIEEEAHARSRAMTVKNKKPHVSNRPSKQMREYDPTAGHLVEQMPESYDKAPEDGLDKAPEAGLDKASEETPEAPDNSLKTRAQIITELTDEDLVRILRERGVVVKARREVITYIDL